MKLDVQKWANMWDAQGRRDWYQRRNCFRLERALWLMRMPVTKLINCMRTVENGSYSRRPCKNRSRSDKARIKTNPYMISNLLIPHIAPELLVPGFQNCVLRTLWLKGAFALRAKSHDPGVRDRAWFKKVAKCVYKRHTFLCTRHFFMNKLSNLS